ncbi:MAG: GIY-YIG nuclease family protein [Patescibacteria group bacterium]
MRRQYHFYIYILTNYRRTSLYIGFTDDIIRRTIEHKFEIGSFFTSRYRLKYLVYFEEYKYVDMAIAREKELKGWRRERKEELIKKNNPLLLDLSEKLFKDCGYSNDDVVRCAEELKSLHCIDPSLRSTGTQDDKK